MNNTGMGGYINGTYDLETLYREMELQVRQVEAIWSYVPASDGSEGSTATAGAHTKLFLQFSTYVNQLRQLIAIPLDTDAASPIMYSIFDELQGGAQKLRRKLERISDMVSDQIQLLTPSLLICTNFEFLNSLKPSRRLSQLNSTNAEHEVLKLMAAGILDEITASKQSPKGRFEFFITFGQSIGRKRRKLKIFQNRLQVLEKEEKVKGSKKPNIFDSCSNLVLDKNNTSDSILNPFKAENQTKVDISLMVTDPEIASNEGEHNGILNENMIEVVWKSKTPKTIGEDGGNDSAIKDNCRIPLGHPSSEFRNVVDEANELVTRVINKIRSIERSMYDPPKEIMRTKVPHQGLKDFVRLVLELGIDLHEKLNRQYGYRKSQNMERTAFTEDQIQLIHMMGSAYQSGLSCQEQFELLTSKVQKDTDDLELVIQRCKSSFQPFDSN